MENEFDSVLDKCIDRVNRGETIETCLRDYREHSAELAPLLRAMFDVAAAYSFTPSVDAKRAARQRFHTALEKTSQPSFRERLFARRLVWATVAVAVVVLIGGYFALRNTVFPTIPTTTITSPTPTGNFAFLVSDDVNAIAEFSEVNVTIDKVTLLKGGASPEWVEFAPEVAEFNLALLPGEETQELWRGNIPEGNYTKVIIYVSNVNGTLKSTGESVNIKSPSNKLQISLPFKVSADSVTSFIYDLTVVKTGNEHNVKYILKPQAGESGATQQPIPNKGNSSSNNNHKNKPD